MEREYLVDPVVAAPELGLQLDELKSVSGPTTGISVTANGQPGVEVGKLPARETSPLQVRCSSPSALAPRCGERRDQSAVGREGRTTGTQAPTFAHVAVTGPGGSRLLEVRALKTLGRLLMTPTWRLPYGRPVTDRQ